MIIFSLTWLKTQFRRLGLKRRGQSSSTSIAIARNCIRVSVIEEIDLQLFSFHKQLVIVA